jgi:hypothetical protein
MVGYGASRLTHPTSFFMVVVVFFIAVPSPLRPHMQCTGAVDRCTRGDHRPRSSDDAPAARRDAKWRIAKQQNDLGRMKVHDFIDVCEAIGVVGKSVKQILQNEFLMLRNACGHPNSASVAENSVAAHIEKLIKNVFSRF